MTAVNINITEETHVSTYVMMENELMPPPKPVITVTIPA